MNDAHDRDPARLLAVAREAALDAGRLARRLLDEPRAIRAKGRRDIVTDADLAAQELITGRIRAAFPNHGFMPEEADSDLPTGGPVLWIIDPIDGTTNYSRGLPHFAVSIAAVRNPAPELPRLPEDVLAAAVYDPLLDELFTAVPGGAALCNGRAIQPSAVSNLSEAVIGIDWSHEPALRQRGLERVSVLVHEVDVLRSMGSAVLALCWVAAGRVDAYLNYRLKPWDVAAAGLILSRAGGRITAQDGAPLRLDPAGLDVLATNNHLHEVLTETG